MKTYQVLASYTTYCTVFIDAENEDEAHEVATQMDGGDFKQDGYGDWNIDQVMEFELCKQE
jgi:hypothetical protein